MMAVSVGFSSYLLLSALCFSSLISCSEISTERGRDGPPAVSEQTTTDKVRSTERGSYRTPRRDAVSEDDECVCEEQCGFQLYDKDTKEPNRPFITLCSCPEGMECANAGDMAGQHFYFYKCRKSTEEGSMELNVDAENVGGTNGMNRAEGRVDSAATTRNDATTEDGMDEETASEFYSIWQDRVGPFEDRFEL